MFRVVGIVLSAICLFGCGRDNGECSKAPPAAAVKQADEEPISNTKAAVLAELGKHFKVASESIDVNRSLMVPPLKADDLDLVEIVMNLEERFQVEIPDSLIEKHGNGKLGDKSFDLTPLQLVTIVDESKLQATKRK